MKIIITILLIIPIGLFAQSRTFSVLLELNRTASFSENSTYVESAVDTNSVNPVVTSNKLGITFGISRIKEISKVLWFEYGLWLGYKSYTETFPEQQGEPNTYFDLIRQYQHLDLEVPTLLQIRFGRKQNPYISLGSIWGFQLKQTETHSSDPEAFGSWTSDVKRPELLDKLWLYGGAGYRINIKNDHRLTVEVGIKSNIRPFFNPWNGDEELTSRNIKIYYVLNGKRASR